MHRPPGLLRDVDRPVPEASASDRASDGPASGVRPQRTAP